MEQFNTDSFTPNEGLTDSEKYLQRLCKKTFLSLWSYPGLYKSPGDELCDLLVVFENNIIIFSDKYCKFPNSGNLQKDWNRWFKRAISKSAKQVWGAERWIRMNPHKIFSNQTATELFPFYLPDPDLAMFHLIVVAHDGSRRCAQEHGGSGSFMLRSDLRGINNHVDPFIIGDLERGKTFVHVLDDTSLNILLNKLDTISDFTAYLEKKQMLFRSKIRLFAAGEEELLAHYLMRTNKKGIHDFILPENSDHIVFPEGIWQDFITNSQVERQFKADRISYIWDELIEQFSFHALMGTQYRVTQPALHSSEKILRLMAKEPRLTRRMLAKSIIDLLENTPHDKQATRYFGPANHEIQQTTYVFLLFPKKEEISLSQYREERGALLQAYCQIAKLRFPYAKDIVGIATEPNIKNQFRSEDSIYLDASQWTEELQKNTEELFKSMGLQHNVVLNHYHDKEYPDIVSNDPKILVDHLPKNPRNKPCLCGSGKKYKKCHGE